MAGCAGVVAVAVHLIGGGSDPVAAPINPGEGVRLATTSPSPSATASSSPTPSASASARRKAKPKVVVAKGPLTLSIAAIGTSAPVRTVGVTSKGDVDIPEQVGDVGWYRYSARIPASQGSTVLVGHVDSATQGKGAFFRLRELTAGDRIVLRTDKARSYTYKVVSREQFPKKRINLEPYFSLTGSPRLSLITCGGSFDETVRSYRDNLIITAVPV